nr:hypothetical protein [Tanacetum cinerariifolium]
TSSVNKSSSLTNNSNQQDTRPTTNIQPTSEPSTLTYVHTEENNVNQAEKEHLLEDEFTNPFYTLVQEVVESSSHNIDHPLEQVIGNPYQSIRTRRQLEIDDEMCMFALTVSQTEPKNIKEAMADSAWIEAIIGTPMATKHLDADLSGTLVDQMKYRSMVGALMYLTASRPDIVHATCYCARYQVKPTEKHLIVVKKNFRWSSKKQDCTSMSSSKAEYVSLSACCTQVLWLRTQLTDYGFHFDKIPMYYDSKAATAISCNIVQHSSTKHIDVRYHFIKEKVEKGIVELFFFGTEYQLADLFTKDLSEDRFKYLVRRLGMRCLTPEELEVLANESA